MVKMPCLFVRTFHGRNEFTITDSVTPGCEWVLAGEGSASRKRDGTACKVIGGELFKRYDAKKDKKTGVYKMPPPGSVPCSEPDPVTGHWPHWTSIGPTDYWHAEAFERQRSELVDEATYELCGPKLQGNPEKLSAHTLIRHGAELVLDRELADGTPLRQVVLNFEGLREYLSANPFEGIVFAHPDGRYAKIRRVDFGLPWPASPKEL